jgi:hypothetical protein
VKVAQDVVLGNDEQAGQSREGRLNTGAEFSAVPSGLLDGAFLTQDCVLGYFQPSIRDSVKSSHADSKAPLFCAPLQLKSCPDTEPPTSGALLRRFSFTDFLTRAVGNAAVMRWAIARMIYTRFWQWRLVNS